MSKRSNQRERAITKISAHLLRSGLGETSLRQLASAADVSDRMLLYYFSNKDEVLAEALRRIAHDLAIRLNEAMPNSRRLSAYDLFEHGSTLTEGRSLQPYMRVSLEIAAAAGRGDAPFAEVANEIMIGFLDWIEARLETTETKQRKAEAAMLLAMIDGLAYMSVCGKKSAARQARAAFLDQLQNDAANQQRK